MKLYLFPSQFYKVQGLINTNDLASETPPLNMTKLLEFHGYLYTHKPDILILNETWLKKSIEDNELLPSSYNIIRVDRSSKTHPYDPKFPKKFRKNGGGVLIAHRTDIDISVSKLSLVSCQAELLSVVIKFPNDEKLCVSTVNFSEVAWPEGSTSCKLHRSFLEFFSRDLGHVQMISEATHKSGNVLDLLFTNVPHIIEDIAILDQNEVCLSDHKGITL